MKAIEEVNSQLKEKLLHWLPEPSSQYGTPVKGVGIYQRDSSERSVCNFYRPTVTLMVQGHKLITVGTEKYEYHKNQCLIVGVDVPTVGFITEATPEEPCITMAVDIDRYLISQLAAEIKPSDSASNSAIATIDADEELLGAFLRLIKTLDKPESIPVLAPLIIKEIHYRLLITPLGERLKMINTAGTPSNQIAEAVKWLKTNYKQTLYVEDLAARVNMAISTFHRHFKEMTAHTPVQYQKRLRLYEAQRLMVFEHMDVTTAGYEVGYESTTQFIKEYKRMFGEPPHRDVKKMFERKHSAIIS